MAEEVGSYAGTVDVTGRSHPDSSRRYGGPLVQQYRMQIILGTVTFVLVVIAIALGASGVKKGNEALRMAEANEKAMVNFAETMTITSVEGAPSPPQIDMEPAPVDTATPPPPAPDTADATPAAPDTPADTAPPTAPKPTWSPTGPHPRGPKWFHTDHSQYQEIVTNDGNVDFHSHLHAGMFCHRQSMHLCPLEVYCPNGQGTRPYGGGPPEISPYETDQEKQWAPYLIGEDSDDQPDGQAGVWVQVGIVSELDGGYTGNGFGQCWTWDDWMMGGGGDIEKSSSDEYRQWILCCEAE